MNPLPRRHFLAQAAGLLALSRSTSSPAETPVQSGGLIDCNVHLGPHPNRDLPSLTASVLAGLGVDEAWAAPYEALLQRDIATVNARHVARCSGPFRPVGVVHPGLPDWQDDLHRCKEQHGLKIIRLYPGYHGYTLEDPRFLGLLELAAEAQLGVQIVVQMEDQRTQHPLMQVKPVELKPLAAAMKRTPEARVMVLNATSAMVMTTLRGVENLWLDFTMVESVGTVENLLKIWPATQIVLSTHAPFFYPQSSLLKLQESELTPEQQVAIGRGNALAWIG